MYSKVLPLALAGAASLTAFVAGAQSQMSSQTLTQTCAFRDGARAGQVIDFSSEPNSTPVSVGSRCADMQGSSGEAVAAGTRSTRPGRMYMSPGAPRAWDQSGTLRQGYTLTCRFDSGPRAGTSRDFTGTLGAEPVAIGSACSDGSSRGVGVGPSQ
jgi:hypothetical protein